MTVESRPLTELTEQAIRLLYRELGVVDTVRFLQQFHTGLGDYTKERRETRPNESLDDLVGQIQNARGASPNLDVTDARPDEPYAQRMAKIRTQYPRAYEKWTEDEDADLQRRHAEGASLRELAALLGRQPGAIESRLRRLGAIR